MENTQSVPEGINKEQTHNNVGAPSMERTEHIDIWVTPDELEFINTITRLVSKMNIQGQTAIKEDNIAEFIRFCMTWIGSIYQTQIFVDSRLLNALPDKNSKLDFIAFREKYMNFPKEAQLAEFKELGLVRKKQK